MNRLFMSSDVNLIGIYFSPMFIVALLALLILLLLRKVFDRFLAYRLFWYRSVIDLALYVLIVAGLLFLSGGASELPLWS